MHVSVGKNYIVLRNRQKRVQCVLSKSYVALFNSTTQRLLNVPEEVSVFDLPMRYLIIELSHGEVTC